MHQRPRRPSLPVLVALASLAAGTLLSSRAEAACSLSACDASTLVSNAACCTASTCTIDGTLTVSGPICTFDFGTRNLTVSGQVAAQGKTVTLKAKSMKLTGLLDVRGPSGADAGNITIVTTGMTAVAYSQEGGTSAIINASSTAGVGGHVTIQADGMVSLAKGNINANGGSAASGGAIQIETSAGDVSVQIPVTASSGATALAPNGSIVVITPGDLTVGGSGRFIADSGDVDFDVTGLASFAAGSFIQTNAGGSIGLVAGSVTSFGEFRATGDNDSAGVELEALTGPMFLQRPSEGFTVGPGASVTLTTDGAGPDGLLTMDMPIVTSGAEVEISSGGSLVISKKIQTTGLFESDAGDISIDAIDDVDVTKAIVGAHVYDEADLTIDARDITIEGNLDFRGGLETPGGSIEITADRDLVVQGDIFLNVSGADSSDGGSVALQAGRNLTVGPSVELIADGSQIGSGGTISLIAGLRFTEFLPGDLVFEGDVKANGHTPAGVGTSVTMLGCNVQIPVGAVIDAAGDALSTIAVTARSGLTIGGVLKSTLANVLEFATGATVSLTGTFAPASSAGTCTGGTPTASGCDRPVCTGATVPAGCLDACPACGDGQTQFPETCDVGAGGPFCDGPALCDAQCRSRPCVAPNSCLQASCDAEQARCINTMKIDGTACDDDSNVCTGVGTCSNGVCHQTPGTALQCDDQNPCTGPDTCDEVTGCSNPDRPDGPGQPGCDDGLFCTGAETCVSGQCVSGPLPCTSPQVCNPQTQQCEGPAACVSGAECNDGNPCTDDVCDAGFCSNPPVSPGTNCDDGNLCNGVRTCNGTGVCQQPTPPTVCNDNDVCTVDVCNTLTGQCIFTDTPGCCTTNADCDDANACTTDTCTQGNTCTHSAVVCNDGDPCTDDVCTPGSGCGTTPIDGCQACADASTCPDDADPCTDKACTGGRCEQVGNPNCCQSDADCTDIDSNPCTDNGTCDPGTHRCGTPILLTGTSCGTTCNPATCQNGNCVEEPPMDCSDTDPCTTDLCTDGEGCSHTHIDECCFTTSECVDQNVCTEDSCDLDANRCAHPAPDPTCTPCSGADPFECGPRCLNTCQGGRCTDVPPNCADQLPCTDDACDPTSGCTHTPTCDDHDACTDDACGASGCTHTAIPGCKPPCIAGTCDDGDPCTIDGCSQDGTGCVHEPKGSFDSVLCRFDGMTTALDGGAPDAVSPKLKKRLQSMITKLRAKITKASAPTLKCKKAKNLLGRVRGPLRKLQKTVNRLAGKQITPEMATELATLAGEAAARAEATRADLGC